MRRTALFVCSTTHLPVVERNAIDHLILFAPRDAAGRLVVQHPELVIEPHLYGFFVHTGIVECGGDPPAISTEFFGILKRASRAGASWILFDRDEPPTPDLPTFPGP